VVAITLLIAMQIGDVAGDELADVVPRAGADTIARIDRRRVATLFLAEIGVPSACGGLPATGPRFGKSGPAPTSPPRLPVPDGLSATKKLAT
jgi:hypothetical protein